MPKPTVILVGADKGGVGKTTVARTLLDYLMAEKLPPRAFDTELPKGTLSASILTLPKLLMLPRSPIRCVSSIRCLTRT